MALELKGACEKCGVALTAGGLAHICSYECTYCVNCAEQANAVCPNCGGGADATVASSGPVWFAGRHECQGKGFRIRRPGATRTSVREPRIGLKSNDRVTFLRNGGCQTSSKYPI
jgi:uncharacterized protein